MGALIEPVLTAALAANFSPRPWMAPPPLGRVIVGGKTAGEAGTEGRGNVAGIGRAATGRPGAVPELGGIEPIHHCRRSRKNRAGPVTGAV